MTETELVAALSQFTTDQLVGEWSRRIEIEAAEMLAQFEDDETLGFGNAPADNGSRWCIGSPSGKISPESR